MVSLWEAGVDLQTGYTLQGEAMSPSSLPPLHTPVEEEPHCNSLLVVSWLVFLMKERSEMVCVQLGVQSLRAAG